MDEHKNKSLIYDQVWIWLTTLIVDLTYTNVMILFWTELLKFIQRIFRKECNDTREVEEERIIWIDEERYDKKVNRRESNKKKYIG